MNPTRKTITLPSGATCLIRRFSGMDFIRSGKIPSVLPSTKRQITKVVESSDGEVSVETVEQGVRVSILAMTRCCGALTYPDGSKRRIVDKPFDECSDSELSVEELDQVDAEAIVKAVSEFSSLNKEVSKDLIPFPEKQAADGDSSPGGEALRKASDGASQPAVG